MKKSSLLLPFFVFFCLPYFISSCYNIHKYQGFSAKITDIRIAKHGLKVIDVIFENRSNEKVEVKTTAMGSNGIMYIAFDKKLYDNSGKNTTIGLNEVFLNPNEKLALTWIPFTKKEESNEIKSLIILINMGGVEKSITLD